MESTEVKTAERAQLNYTLRASWQTILAAIKSAPELVVIRSLREATALAGSGLTPMEAKIVTDLLTGKAHYDPRAREGEGEIVDGPRPTYSRAQLLGCKPWPR